jgi:hypothetical protein
MDVPIKLYASWPLRFLVFENYSPIYLAGALNSMTSASIPASFIEPPNQTNRPHLSGILD